MAYGIMLWGFLLLVLLHGAGWLRGLFSGGSPRWRSTSSGSMGILFKSVAAAKIWTKWSPDYSLMVIVVMIGVGIGGFRFFT
jgi:hypothetical protein